MSFDHYSPSFQAHPLEAAQSHVGGLCLLKAAEISPATLVASQLLPPGQLTPSSIQRLDHTKQQKLWNSLKECTDNRCLAS